MNKPSADRYNQGKRRVDLIDALALEGLADGLGFGAKKYDDDNWRKGLSYRETIASLLRHLLEIQKGNDIDEESGLPHIDLVGCNWMFLSHHMKNPELHKFDDRFHSKYYFDTDRNK